METVFKKIRTLSLRAGKYLVGNLLIPTQLSIWPKRLRDPQEPISLTKDIHLPKGCTIPDFIRIAYGTTPTPINSRFPFTSRDTRSKERDEENDQYISTRGFHSDPHVKKWLEVFAQITELLDLPIKDDPDRGTSFVDSVSLIEEIVRGGPDRSKNALLAKAEDNYNIITFLTSELDICKKWSLVRAIPFGWWVVSYNGKDSEYPGLFEDALGAMGDLLDAKKSEIGHRYKETMAGVGQPRDTNLGYPYFANVKSEDDPGLNILRVQLLDHYGKHGLMNSVHDWASLKLAVDKYCPVPELKGFPFAIAPLRRMQAGYKWQRTCDYNMSQGGQLEVTKDVKGVNTVRVAWMAPYLLSVLMTPLAVAMKASRYFFPGAYHDGATAQLRADTWRKRSIDRYKELGGYLTVAQSLTALRSVVSSSYDPSSVVPVKQGHHALVVDFFVEADYSNYDRYIPTNVASSLYSLYADRSTHAKFWRSVAHGIHNDIPLLMPDGGTSSDVGGAERGTAQAWAFYPGKLGLLSGLLVTSEEGSGVNYGVQLTAWCATQSSLGKLQAAPRIAMRKYVTSVKPGNEEFLVLSDDTALRQNSLFAACVHATMYAKIVPKAGMKFDLTLGDRFLMKHLNRGLVSPVLARIVQNTISAEEPVSSPFVFMLGIMARLEGVLGLLPTRKYATGSPKGTPSTLGSQLGEDLATATTWQHYGVTPLELWVTRTTFHLLRARLVTAPVPLQDAIALMDLGLEVTSDFSLLDTMHPKNIALWVLHQGNAVIMLNEGKIQAWQKRLTSLAVEYSGYQAAYAKWLAEQSSNVGSDQYLVDLLKNVHSPSARQQLIQFFEANPEAMSLANGILSRDHDFYLKAVASLNIQSYQAFFK